MNRHAVLPSVTAVVLLLSGCGGSDPDKSDNPYERPAEAVKAIIKAETTYAAKHGRYTSNIADLIAENGANAEWITHSDVRLNVSGDGQTVVVRATNSGSTYLSFRTRDGATGDLHD
jgi:hypothetical protein